jgi:hypothetical protein
MEPKWAEENLQTIRTLMERSAIYRRALAPIMIFVGFVGVLTAAVEFAFHFNSMFSFCWLWLGSAMVAVAGAFLIARRQALNDKDAFWSPPTRRVAQALFPPLATGMCLGVVFSLAAVGNEFTVLVGLLWVLFYGCALNAASFFMPRGVRFFGWIYIAGGCCQILLLATGHGNFVLGGGLQMGLFFGILHLIYGAYLYLTEKKNPIA